MQESLNAYGDRMVRTTGSHGADISIQRMDDLDISAVTYALKTQSKGSFALDVGCGFGIQGLRFATLGYNSVLIDILQPENTVVNSVKGILPIRYIETDVRLLKEDDLPEEIMICYSQRFVHYLKFQEARSLLILLKSRMPSEAKLFLSASGLKSELGLAYADGEKALNDRFSALSPDMAEKHDIHMPVCLYTEADLTELCESAGFVLDKVQSSAFGNIKGIFSAS